MVHRNRPVIAIIGTLLLIGVIDVARAYVDYPSSSNGIDRMSGVVQAVLNSAGIATPLQTIGSVTQTSVTCGTASTPLLAAGSASGFIRIASPSASAGSVWFNWTGAPAVTAPPSDEIRPGGIIVWQSAAGYLPTSAMTCIAAAPTPVTLVYR